MERMREKDYFSKEYIFAESHNVPLSPEISKKSEKLRDEAIRKMVKSNNFLEEICKNASKIKEAKWDFGMHGDTNLINTRGDYFTICYYRKVGSQ